MTKYDLKKSPKGRMYPISKKDMRNFINNLDARFDYVIYGGTADTSLSFGQYFWFGELESQRVNGEWYFSLNVRCLKEDQIVPWKEHIAKITFAKIREWVEKKQSLPCTAIEKPRSLFLKFEIKNGRCLESCFEVDQKRIAGFCRETQAQIEPRRGG
jgi:hypothetical protein